MDGPETRAEWPETLPGQLNRLRRGAWGWFVMNRAYTAPLALLLVTLMVDQISNWSIGGELAETWAATLWRYFIYVINSIHGVVHVYAMLWVALGVGSLGSRVAIGLTAMLVTTSMVYSVTPVPLMVSAFSAFVLMALFGIAIRAKWGVRLTHPKFPAGRHDFRVRLRDFFVVGLAIAFGLTAMQVLGGTIEFSLKEIADSLGISESSLLLRYVASFLLSSVHVWPVLVMSYWIDSRRRLVVYSTIGFVWVFLFQFALIALWNNFLTFSGMLEVMLPYWIANSAGVVLAAFAFAAVMRWAGYRLVIGKPTPPEGALTGSTGSTG